MRKLRGQGGGLVPAFLVQHRRTVAAQADLRERGECGRELLRSGQSLTGRHESVGQTDRRRLLGVDSASSEDHVHRPAGPDEPRQAHGAAVDQRNAPAAAEDAEDGGLVRHPQVAPQRQLEAAGHRVPRYRRDDRLRQPQPADTHRPVAVGRGPVGAFGAHRGQVGAGAEHPARTVQDRDGGVRIGVERAEGRGELGGGGAVDGVAAGRAVQEDGADGPGPLHPDCLLSHRQPPPDEGPAAC